MDGSAEKNYGYISEHNEGLEAARLAYIQEPWDHELDTQRFLDMTHTVAALQEAYRAKPDKRSPKSDIDKHLAEFVTYQDVVEKAFDKWDKDEERSAYANDPEQYLLDYIEAAARLGETDGDPEQYLGFSVPLLGRYIEKFGETVNQHKNDESRFVEMRVDRSFQALSLYMAYGKDGQIKQKAFTYLSNNIDYIDQQLQPTDLGYVNKPEFFPMIMQIYKGGSPEQKALAGEMVIKVLSLPRPPIGIMYEFDRDNYNYTLHLRPLEGDFLQIIDGHLKKYGLHTKGIIKEWITTPEMSEWAFEQTRRRFDKAIPLFIRNISVLEKAYPGSARILQERFGINHFHRYPAELLIRQYEERDDYSKPHGVILGATDDYNEATSGNVDAYKKLLDEVGDKFSIRVTECDSKYGSNGIGRRLLSFNKAYFRNGEGHKIGFLIINGHGNVEGTRLWFGRNVNHFGTISIQDLNRQRVQNVKDSFTDSPEVVFVSCDVGRELAREVSQTLHAKVFANTQIDNRVEDFGPKIDEDKVILDPLYADFGEKGKVLFVNGVEQQAA